MKSAHWTIVGLTLAIGMSGLSLALQATRNTSKFERYSTKPTTEFYSRSTVFDLEVLREELPFDPPISTPRFAGLTADNKKLLIKVPIAIDDILPRFHLPKDFEERKGKMKVKVVECEMAFASAFGDNPALSFKDDAVVQFINMSDDSIIATYENGQLSMR